MNVPLPASGEGLRISGPLSSLQSRFTAPRVVGLAILMADALTTLAGIALVAAQPGKPSDSDGASDQHYGPAGNLPLGRDYLS